MLEISRTHEKTAAQTALRFLYQEGIVVIPKSVHAERMEENLAIFDFELSADELNEIEKLEVGRSLFVWW